MAPWGRVVAETAGFIAVALFIVGAVVGAIVLFAFHLLSEFDEKEPPS